MRTSLAGRTFVSPWLLAALCGMCALAQAAPASAHTNTVRVRNTDELVTAMLAASSSRRPTLIKVAPGTYELNQTFPSDSGGSELPPVNTLIAIVARDPDTTTFVGGMQLMRAFAIQPHGALLVEGITFSGHFAACDSVINCSLNGGGVVANFGGNVWIEDCVLSGNSSRELDGGGGLLGGAVMNIGGHVWIERTTLFGNSVNGYGGAIAVVGGTVTLRHSIVSSNFTFVGRGEIGQTIGGGIYVGENGTLIVDSSTIAGNTVTQPDDPDFGGSGGGISNAGTVWMTDSAVTENFGTNYGYGGGILNGGRMTLESTTVSGNSAGTQGGGIFNGGQLTLRGVTVARNEVRGDTVILRGIPAGCEIETPELCISRGGGIWNQPGATVRISDTALVDNVNINTRVDGGTDCEGVVISEGFNAIGTTANCTVQPAAHSGLHDVLNVDARIGEVEDNGEPGEAHVPLLAGSPLIDAGGKVDRNCTRRDQLGHRRADGNGDGIIRCDIGAIEFHGH